MSKHNSIVASGRDVAYQAENSRVRRQVALEFSEALAGASFFTRFILYARMKLEIHRRMKRAAPPGALYSRPGHGRK